MSQESTGTLWSAAEHNGRAQDAVLPDRSLLVSNILAMNPTASVPFLDRFDDHQLQSYLEHLLAVQIPRGPDARRSRPSHYPAVMVSEPAD